MSHGTYEIVPIRVGSFHGLEHSVLTLGRNFGQKLISPIIMYLVRNNEHCLLVDCGGSDEDWSTKHHTKIVRPPEEEPVAALAAHGVRPGDIAGLILTHLHWDHCFNTHLFPKASIYVQERELLYAMNPLPADHRLYEATARGFTPPWMRDIDRIRLVQGDQPLLPGIDLIALPGHSPGFQGVLVVTRQGRYLIASDCLGLLSNWPADKDWQRAIPSGLYSSMAEYYTSLEKISRICDHILPGHDPKVFDQAKYPAD